MEDNCKYCSYSKDQNYCVDLLIKCIHHLVFRIYNSINVSDLPPALLSPTNKKNCYKNDNEKGFVDIIK